MPAKPDTITFGVIADTHIPDRTKMLPEGLLEALQHMGVNQILHAGDVSSWAVIHALEEIAPVTVVQGNRDWLYRMKTPLSVSFVANTIRISMAHGHRTMVEYLIDKWAYIRNGYLFERYYAHLSKDYPDADVIIFGHTHHQTARWVAEQLLFNPGACYPCEFNHYKPQFGVLSITAEGVIRTTFHDIPQPN